MKVKRDSKPDKAIQTLCNLLYSGMTHTYGAGK